MYEYIKGILNENHCQIHRDRNSWDRLFSFGMWPTHAYSGKWNQEVHIYSHQGSGEDAHLHGYDRRETALFKLDLCSLGIGPVSASLAIIAVDDNVGSCPSHRKNITYLTKFPKIARKQPNR